MQLETSEQFLEQLGQLPPQVQRAAHRKILYLGENPAHPSLHVKRVKTAKGLYEARVNLDYRLLFEIEGDTIQLIAVGRHSLLDRF